MNTPHIGIHLTGLHLREDGSIYQLHAGTVDVQEDDGRIVRRGRQPSSSELASFTHAPQQPEEALGNELWHWLRGVAPITRLWVKHATFSHLAQRHHWFEHEGVLTLILYTIPSPELELELLAHGFAPMLATWRAPATEEARELAARVAQRAPETHLVFDAAGARVEDTQTSAADPEGHRLHEAANHAWARLHALDPTAAAPTLNIRRRTLMFGFEEEGAVAWTMALTIVPGRITYPAVFTRGRNRIEVASLSWRDFLRLGAIGRALKHRDTTRAMAAEFAKDLAPVTPRRRAEAAEQLFEQAPSADADVNFSRLLDTLRQRQPELVDSAALSPEGRVKAILEDLTPPEVTPDHLRTWLEDQAWFDAADVLDRHEAESVDEFMDRLWSVIFERHLVTSLVERDGTRLIVPCSSLVGDGQDAAVLRLVLRDEGPELSRIPVQVIDDCARGRCWVTAPGDRLRGDEELINLRRHTVEQVQLLQAKLRALEAELRRAPAALEQLREALTLATVLTQSPRCQGSRQLAALEMLARAKNFYDAARELYAEGRPAASLQHIYDATERIAAAAAEASLLCAEGGASQPTSDTSELGIRDVAAPDLASPAAVADDPASPTIERSSAELPSIDMGDPSEVYIYQADLWCGRCGRQLRQDLAAKGKAPERPDDETSYDSDEFPKGPYRPEESDSPEHCAAGPNCLAAEGITAPDGERRVGHFMKNPLTDEGRAYVSQAVAEGSPVAVQIWGPFYGIDADRSVAERSDDEGEYLRPAIQPAPGSRARKPTKLDLRGFGPRTQHMLLRGFSRSFR